MWQPAARPTPTLRLTGNDEKHAGTRRAPRTRQARATTAKEDDVSRAAAQAATWYQQTFHGRADQVARVRREIAAHLDGCPAADDAVLIAS